MRNPVTGFGPWWRQALAALVMTVAVPSETRACTIFVLTDDARALFFNNEDWFNPSTRLWFVPAGNDHLGCAYLGFDNGWAQGGLNTAGLAFDWVSGFEESYVPAPELKPVRGNPSERMLESCKTVDEAVAFYRTYREPDFARSRILVADRTGASVVIGARNGAIHVSRYVESRGFGWGRVALERELAKKPEPTVANGAAILRACLQPGEGGTKYSNIFDLKSGDMVLLPIPGGGEGVTLNLAAELGKGGHYYDLPHIRTQLHAEPRPLLSSMKRFYLDEWVPIPDTEADVTARILRLIQDAAAGTMREADYAAGFWKNVSSAQKEIQADLKRLGPLVSLTLVERREVAEGRSYRYLVEFKKARVLSRYVLGKDGSVVGLASEFVEATLGSDLRS